MAYEDRRSIQRNEKSMSKVNNDNPLDMLLFCPQCGEQHIDEPQPEKGWDNPPHKSHACQFCGCIWRPSDRPTNGVVTIASRGGADTHSARPRYYKTAKDFDDALSATSPVSEPPREIQWLDIESAPKDGTDILLWDGWEGYGYGVACWSQGWMWSGAAVCDEHSGNGPIDPTHWQPLPAPPVIDAITAEKEK